MERKRGFIHLRRDVRDKGACEERISAGLWLSFTADLGGMAQEFEDKIKSGNDEAGQLPLFQPF